MGCKLIKHKWPQSKNILQTKNVPTDICNYINFMLKQYINDYERDNYYLLE